MTLSDWRLAAALLFAFCAGWTLCSWRQLIKLERLELANNFLGRAVIDQLGYIERLEAGRDIGEQADEYLREQGGRS